MKTADVSTFRHIIAETDYFKGLDQVVRKITLSRQNVAKISHGVAVAKNIGLKKWEKQTALSPRNVELVKDIINGND